MNEMLGRPSDYSIAVRCIACGLDEHGRVGGLLCCTMGRAFGLIDVFHRVVCVVITVATFGRVRS